MPNVIQLPPPDLTPWSMFQSADLIVKLVILLLVVASVVTWTVLLVKSGEIIAARKRLKAAMRGVETARSLEDLLQTAELGPLLVAAEAEIAASTGLPPEGVKDRVATRLSRIEAALARRMGRGIGVLASIGATAPFVGLFGTVWGIMNSFVGISQTQTTNLAVVAPGIAEALLATAFGLIAAIPAVVIYNIFARSIATYRALVGDAAAGVLGLASRDLDRRALRFMPPIESNAPSRHWAEA
jgi:biopolymer transport protein ExbB